MIATSILAAALVATPAGLPTADSNEVVRVVLPLRRIDIEGPTSFTVDASLPAGNIIVDGIKGDRVDLHQDLRDTEGGWFYWAFRVKGAAGRTLKFHFTGGPAVGSRGAAYSLDHGKSWRWTYDAKLDPRNPKTRDHASSHDFTWRFAKDQNEVWFSQTIPYAQSDWEAFIAAHEKDRGRLFETSVLCTSRKGRAVETARFGRLDGQAPFRLFFSSRHHCGEATATYVLEGVCASVFRDDELGAWLRANAEIRVVPFVDKDGVVDGDQGKNRRPHDHARDYNEDRAQVYPEVSAIMKMLTVWKPSAVIVLHCPWLRGDWNQKDNSNEYIYMVGLKDARFAASQRRLGELLEKCQTSGVGYSADDNYSFGRGWNSGANYKQGSTAIMWTTRAFPAIPVTTCIEIPFANSRFTTLEPPKFRAFGRDLAEALRMFLADPAADSSVEMRTGVVFGEPVVIASTPAEGMGLAREGTKLYTGAKDVLRVYETAEDSLHPRLLGEVKVPNGAAVRQLAVRDGLVGISAREGQVMFFDFKDAAHPRFLSRYDCCELATGIDFGGDVCFCGQRNYGVEFIDVRDPTHPAHIAMRKTDESQSVVYRDGYCYSGEWGTGHVTVFDCRDLSKIVQTAHEELHGVGDGVWLDGDLLFVATGHHSKHRPTAGLRTFEPEDLKKYSLGRKIDGAGAGHGLDVFSIADPAHPRHLGRVDYPPYYSRGNDFWTVRANGVKGLVFAAQAYNGLFAVDVSNPVAPRVCDRFVLPCTTRAGAPSAVIGSIAVGDGVVYVAAHEHGILAVPAKGAKPQHFNRGVAPKHPEFREPYPNNDARFACWRPETRGQVRGAAVKGDLVYAACGDAGLYALRVKGDRLETIRRVPGIAQAYDVDLKGDRLVAAEGRRGWAFYRIGTDGELSETARIRKSPEGKDFGFWAWMLSERWTVLSPRNGSYLLVDTLPGATHGRDGAPPPSAVPGKPTIKALLPVRAPGWSKYLPDRLVQDRWLCWNMGNTAAAWVEVTAPTVGRLKLPVIQSEPKYRGGPTNGCGAFGDQILFMRGDGFSLYPPGEFADETVPLKTAMGRISGFPRSDGRHLLVCDRLRRQVAFFDLEYPKQPKCLWHERLSGNPDCGVVANGRAFIPCGYQGLLMSK